MLRRWICKNCGEENSENNNECKGCKYPKNWRGEIFWKIYLGIFLSLK